MLSGDLCIAKLVAASGEDVVRTLAQKLHAGGYVGASFEGHALARERQSPTGLPFPGVAVAIPHAEPEDVSRPAIAIASLAKPVLFRQMGAPGIELWVSLVVMPALTAKEQAAGELSRLITLLQDEALRRALVAAETSAALYETLASHSSR
jgi:galactitol PTS system EIIA component